MSAVAVVQTKDKIYVASDTAISFKYKNTPYRLSNNGKKLYQFGDFLVFCSGTMGLAYHIMNQFIQESDKSIKSLSIIAKNLFYEHSKLGEVNLDILIFKCEDTSSCVYQISPYKNFEVICSQIEEDGIKLFSGGIKTRECLDLLEGNIGKHSSVVKFFNNVFSDLNSEEIGGFIEVFKIEKNKVELLDTLEMSDEKIKKFDIETFQPELVIAEQVLGKLILGQRITIGTEDGTWMTEGAATTITDRCNREAMKLGLYDENPDKFGMVINRYDSSEPCSTNLINRIVADSEDGFKIQRWNGTQFVDVFYVDNDGFLYAIDMTAKRLKITSDNDELLLDSESKYMNIGRFDNIITDGKLTGVEKLQVLGERTRIMSEYTKLLAQANIYKETTRDSSIRISTTAFTTAYNNLMSYLSPLLNDMDATSEIDREEFILKFKSYYDEVTNIINAINDSIKYSSVQFGAIFNNVLIDYMQGIIVTRSDNLYRTKLNATEGIAIEKWDANNEIWRKKFYVNVTDGRLWTEELVAKKLTIVNDLDEILLDVDTKYLDIGRFDTIVADGKLTSIEKLTLKQEVETIMTEYSKLLAQANAYKTSQRDNHATILINIPPFTSAYDALITYVTPLLANMNTTSEVDRTIFKNTFQAYYDQANRIINEITNALKWGSVQLGQNYNKVVIDALNGITVTRTDNMVILTMNATEGIKIERDGQPVFFADENGTLHAIDLVAKRLKITSDPFGGATEDTLLIDAENRILNLQNFSVIAGFIKSENILTNTITANDGMIANLTVNHLQTLGKTDNLWAYSNYIDIKDKQAKWITGQIIDRTHAETSDGTKLYWTDASKEEVTTKVTAYPVFDLDIAQRLKMIMDFLGDGSAATPRIIIGEGDGAIKDVSINDGAENNKSGRAFLNKPNGSFDITYYASNFAKERGIKLTDSGVYVLSEDEILDITSKKTFVNSDDNIRLSLDNGSEIEIAKNTGHGTISINHASGASITISPTGVITLSTSQPMNFNAPSYNFS